MRERVSRLVDDLRNHRNLDVIGSAAVGSAIALYSIFGGGDSRLLFSAILLLLSAQSFSLLMHRHEVIDRQSSLNDELVRLSALRDVLDPPTKLRFEYPSDLSAYVSNSRSISLLGISLASMDPHHADLEEFVNGGGHLRVLVCEPTEAVAEFNAYRSADAPDDPTEMLLTLRRRARRLSTLGGNDRAGDTEVKFLSFPPPFGLAIFREREQETPSVFVKLLSFRVQGGRNPVIQATRMPDWSYYFLERFEDLWEVASKYEVD